MHVIELLKPPPPPSSVLGFITILHKTIYPLPLPKARASFMDDPLILPLVLKFEFEEQILLIPRESSHFSSVDGALVKRWFEGNLRTTRVLPSTFI